jgi:hypothetical protein
MHKFQVFFNCAKLLKCFKEDIILAKGIATEYKKKGLKMGRNTIKDQEAI